MWGWNRIKQAERPRSLCVDGMINVDFCTVQSLRDEIEKENELIEKYKEGIDAEVDSYSEQAQQRLMEFKNLVRTNITIIQTKLKEKLELMETEKKKSKYHIPEVKISEETVLTPLIYTADVFQIVFMYLPVKDLLTNVSLACWMFRIFVISRVEIYVDINLQLFKKYPLDIILNSFKIGGIRVRETQNASYHSFTCNEDDLKRITRILDNHKDRLKRLVLTFYIQGRHYYHHDQKKQPIDSVYEDFEKKVSECKKLIDLSLPYFPGFSTLSCLSLRTLSFNLEETFTKKRHTSMIEFFKDEKNTSKLKKVDIRHRNKSNYYYWGRGNMTNVVETEKAKAHVDLFNGISKCKKLREFKCCVLKNFDYSDDFIQKLTKLEVVKLRYCEFYIPQFYDDFSQALIDMQERGEPLKIRTIRLFIISELSNHFENFFALEGIKLIVHSELGSETAKVLRKYKTKYIYRPKKLVWKESKIILKNIENVCKMVVRLGIQRLEIGRVVIKPFTHISRVFKNLKAHEEGILEVTVCLVKGLYSQIGKKRKLLETIRDVVEDEDSFGSIQTFQLRSVKIQLVMQGRSNYRSFPKIGTVGGHVEYSEEDQEEFINVVKKNSSLKRLEAGFPKGSDLGFQIEKIMNERSGEDSSSTKKSHTKNRRKRRRRRK